MTAAAPPTTTERPRCATHVWSSIVDAMETPDRYKRSGFVRCVCRTCGAFLGYRDTTPNGKGKR